MRVTCVRVDEGLSALFDVHVEVLEASADLDLEAMLWSTASVTLEPRMGSSEPRSWHGVLEEARYLGGDEQQHRYAFRLRPAVHGLAYRVRSRIFQQKSAVEIVEQVLTDAGIPADGVRWETQGDYPTREYCTQWKESELAFVLRLLEEEASSTGSSTARWTTRSASATGSARTRISPATR